MKNVIMKESFEKQDLFEHESCSIQDCNFLKIKMKKKTRKQEKKRDHVS